MPYFNEMQIRMSNDPDDIGNSGRPGVGLATRTRPKTKKPSLYKVLLLNDDYTPMEFVVHVLKGFFQMDTDEATRVMLHVHQKGVGICGVFTYEVAGADPVVLANASELVSRDSADRRRRAPSP